LKWPDRLQFCRFRFRSGWPCRALPPDRRSWSPAWAARAATTAAPAKGVGKSLSGLAGGLEKALKAQSPSSVEQPSVAAASPAAQRSLAATNTAPAPASNWEDPGAIDVGITYDELVRRFGPYSMAISDSTQKVLTYRGKTGTFQVGMQDGKVTAVEKPPAPPESR